jgi:hypothetical protein
MQQKWWQNLLRPLLLFEFQFHERFERIDQLVELFDEPRKLRLALIYEVGPLRAYRHGLHQIIERLQPLSATAYLLKMGVHVIIEQEHCIASFNEEKLQNRSVLWKSRGDVEKPAPGQRGAKPRKSMQEFVPGRRALGKRFSLFFATPSIRKIVFVFAFKRLRAARQRAFVQAQGRPHGNGAALSP